MMRIIIALNILSSLCILTFAEPEADPDIVVKIAQIVGSGVQENKRAENDVESDPPEEAGPTEAPVKECLPPWEIIGDGCYMFLTADSNLTWSSARGNCSNYGGDLAVLNTDEKQYAMWQHLFGLSTDRNNWVGATNATGEWLWVDNSPVTTVFLGYAGDCLNMYAYKYPLPSSPGNYTSLPCDGSVSSYICEL